MASALLVLASLSPGVVISLVTWSYLAQSSRVAARQPGPGRAPEPQPPRPFREHQASCPCGCSTPGATRFLPRLNPHLRRTSGRRRLHLLPGAPGANCATGSSSSPAARKAWSRCAATPRVPVRGSGLAVRRPRAAPSSPPCSWADELGIRCVANSAASCSWADRRRLVHAAARRPRVRHQP
jgi:hypothetical protein